MTHNLKYSTALKNDRLNEIAVDVGNGGLLRLYDGAQPASPDVAVGAQTKIAEFTCGAPFAGAAVGGVLTANAIAAVNALVGGTPTWFRLCKADGTAVVDGTVGQGAGFDCNIDNATLTGGQQVSVNSLTITSNN